MVYSPVPSRPNNFDNLFFARVFLRQEILHQHFLGYKILHIYFGVCCIFAIKNKCTNIYDTNNCNAKNFDAKNDVAKIFVTRIFTQNIFVLQFFVYLFLQPCILRHVIFLYLIKMTI